MRESAFPSRRRPSSWIMCLVAGSIGIAAVQPALAAPAVAMRKVAPAKAGKSGLPPGTSELLKLSSLPLPGNIDEQIEMLENSAEFWTMRAAGSLENIDPQTASVLGASCEVHALALKLRRELQQGRTAAAAKLVRDAKNKRSKMLKPPPPPQMQPGMEGMMPEGMSSGMPGSMPGAMPGSAPMMPPPGGQPTYGP